MNRRERILGGVVLAGIGGLTAFLIILSFTDQRLSARLAEFERPESVRAYETQVDEIVARLESVEPLGPHDLDGRNAFSERVSSAQLLRRLQNAVDELLESHRDTAFVIKVRLRYEDGLKLAPGEEPTVEDVSALVHDAEEILAGIHDLADRDFVTMAADPDANWHPFHGSFYFNCTAIVAASAAYQSYTSQARAAFDDIQAGLKISHTLFQEPVLESQRVAVDMASAMAQMIPSAFDPGILPRDWLDELLPELRPPESQRMLLDALAVGAANAVISRGEMWADRSLVEWVDERGVYWGARNWLWRKPICRPMTNLDDQSLLEIGDRIAYVPDVPYYQMKPYLDDLVDYGEDLSIICHSGRRFPRYAANYLVWTTICIVELDITRLGLQIEPFTGDAYRYVPNDDGFLLYSLGWDAVDDVMALIKESETGEGGESSSTDTIQIIAPDDPFWSDWAYERMAWEDIDDIVWRPETYLAAVLKDTEERAAR